MSLNEILAPSITCVHTVVTSHNEERFKGRLVARSRQGSLSVLLVVSIRLYGVYLTVDFSKLQSEIQRIIRPDFEHELLRNP